MNSRGFVAESREFTYDDATYHPVACTGPCVLTHFTLMDPYGMPGASVMELRRHGSSDVLMRLSCGMCQSVCWSGQVLLPDGFDVAWTSDPDATAPTACVAFVKL